MIGSHDSFTYLAAKNSLVNRITRFWRCQDKSIVDQYNFGVRFFDIRVCRDTLNGKKIWRCCHGLAELEKTYPTIKAICQYFGVSLKGCKFRIWLEKGSEADWNDFKKEVLAVKDSYPGFVQSYRKENYELIFEEGYPELIGYNCPMESISNILAALVKYPIRSWARKHNPVITKEMKDDPTKLYLMDFVCGTPVYEGDDDATEITNEEKQIIENLK